jgi:hypothetical protein
MEADLRKVHLGATREIELPKLDVTQHIGKRAAIEIVEECEGTHGYYVRVQTAVLEKLVRGDKKIELRASRNFGLQQDAAGNHGWGRDTKLGVFLRKMNVPHYRDLVGREVVVQTQANKEGTDFLTF